VEADLLTEGAFDSAFSGCSYIFHCASPFFIEAGDPQAELVDPAVRGTRNVMSAAAKNRATVRRVVLTSSCAAVKGMGSPAAPVQGNTYSEADWNETSSLPGEAYWVSKVQAERAAWEAAKEAGLDLITILPGALRWASSAVLCCAVLWG
jgi:dihydroflavonol-4-reductase